MGLHTKPNDIPGILLLERAKKMDTLMKTLTVYCDKDLVFTYDGKPFEDQKEVTALVRKYNTDGNLLWGFKPDTFYQFPFEGEVEVVTFYNPKVSPISVARLVPSQPEESQEDSEELFKTFLGEIPKLLNPIYRRMKELDKSIAVDKPRISNEIAKQVSNDVRNILQNTTEQYDLFKLFYRECVDENGLDLDKAFKHFSITRKHP